MPTNDESSPENDIDDGIWEIAEDYEDKLAKSTRGNAKGGGKKRKEKRAPDSKHELAKKRAEKDNRDAKKAEEAKQSLMRVISRFPKAKSKKKRSDFLDTYVDWLTHNLEAYKAAENTSVFSVEIPENEVKFKFMRSSKHGGQRGDKVSTAARATHLPTKISVKNEEENNQKSNKQNALRILREKLEQHIKNWQTFLENSKGDETDNIFDVIYGKSDKS